MLPFPGRALIVLFAWFAAWPACAAGVSFRNDVQAVIAKAGCNLGTCHGNATGKGGFKMSLRGSDLDYDYAALTQDAHGRRVNEFEPERSLILLKATQALAHEGGKRFARDSWEYKTLRDWLAQGAPRSLAGESRLERIQVTPASRVLIEPEDSVQLNVRAYFTGGEERDVTAVSVYEPAQLGIVKVSPAGKVDALKSGEATIVVRFLDKQLPVTLAFVPARPDFAWEPARQNNFIDRHVFAKLKSLRMNPSAICSDEVFCRRAYLDLLGLPPRGDEARAFVEEKAPDKRERLVDRLLARPEFVDFWSMKWCDVLRVESRTMDERGMKLFHDWIHDAVARNMPVDAFVRGIVGATGSTYEVPPANFYRAMREPNPRAEALAQVFLGTRLRCAQCHNHPFDRWTQDDYFDWAAVFARIDYDVKENLRTDKNDKHEFVGEQVVRIAKDTRFLNARTGIEAKPRLLGAGLVGSGELAKGAELSEAAGWMASAENPLFAQAQVNRIWAHLMGRGLVEPVDDFRITNPATHPELLRDLAREFVRSGFDMRRMIRLVVSSRAYQLESAANETNQADGTNYSHAVVRRLSAEQLFDGMNQALGVTPGFRRSGSVVHATQLPGPPNKRKRDSGAGDAEAFLVQFGQPQRLLACECERSSEPTMSHAFSFVSGPVISRAIQDRSNLLGTLASASASPETALRRLYWSVVARAPTKEELDQFLPLLTAAKERRGLLEDLAWSLLNSKEFVLRR